MTELFRPHRPPSGRDIVRFMAAAGILWSFAAGVTSASAEGPPYELGSCTNASPAEQNTASWVMACLSPDISTKSHKDALYVPKIDLTGRLPARFVEMLRNDCTRIAKTPRDIVDNKIVRDSGGKFIQPQFDRCFADLTLDTYTKIQCGQYPVRDDTALGQAPLPLEEFEQCRSNAKVAVLAAEEPEVRRQCFDMPDGPAKTDCVDTAYAAGAKGRVGLKLQADDDQRATERDVRTVKMRRALLHLDPPLSSQPAPDQPSDQSDDRSSDQGGGGGGLDMGSIPTVSFASSRSTPTRTNPNVVRGNRSFQPLPRGRTSTITGREFGDSIAAYDSTRMAVTTAGNQTISIKPMVTALQKVAPAAAQRPFETGDDGSLHFSQETRRAVSSNRGQLRNVGGVALDVMFESLAAAGVAEARINGPQALIENPVLISLNRLVAAAEPYAVSPERWAQLPDNIRYPGDIGRVRGAVLDPVKQDVFIVGTPAASRETRLDIDVLSVLTDVAWKQGITPGVSLDPTMVPSASSASNVADLSLAMIPRLINLPEGSLVSRILLDADYEMKFINTGQVRIDDPDFNSFFDLLKRDPPSGRQTNRFWFHPVPMTPGSVRLSGDGNVVLFDAAVQVLTEDLDTTAMGTGTANQTSLEAAEKFTRAFDRIETSPDVKPAGIFTLLKAANDVVTFGAILREAGISYPALEELRQLPFRHLAMPASYPSVSAEFIQRIDSSHEKQWKLSGGVTLQSRVHRRSYDQFEDGASAALRKGAAAMKDGEFSATLRTSFMLTRPDPGGSAKATLAKLAGRQLLLTNKPADAATKYAEAAAGDPLDVEAWVWLAISDLAAKRFVDASAAIEKAKLVDPDDALVRGTAVTVALLSGAQLHLDTLDPTLRTGISQQLSEAAGSRLVGGETDAAAEAAGLSVKLWNGNGWAHCVLGVVFSQKGQFPDAVRELGEAPCLRSAPVFILNMRAFDFAKLGDPGRAIADYDEAIRLDPKYAASFDGRGDAYLDRKDTEKALSDFGRAIELDPKRALFRESRGRVLLAKGDTAGAMADFEQAVKLDPGSAPTHFVRASAFLLQKDYAHAMSDIDETIRIDPATPRAYIIRGLAHEGTGNTELALQDYADSIRTQPGQLFAYERRAIIYANKQDFARSIAEYTELLKRDPLYKDAAFNRAMVTGKSGDNAGAIVRFGEAIAADPKSAPAHLWRGIGYLTGGQPDAAIADFSRAIGLDGNNGDAYLRRGRAYEMKGDRANAAADYQAAQRLGRTP